MSDSQKNQKVDILACDCIAWDFDGTLFDLRIDWSTLKARLHSLLQSNPDYAPPHHHSIDALVTEARRLHLDRALFDVITEAEREGLQRWESGLKKVPVEIFLHLKDRSIIVSNNMSQTIGSFLDRMGTPKIAFMSRDKVQQPKPAPEGLLNLKGHWEGKKTVLIGDSPIDQQVAHSCGIPFMHIQDVLELYPHGLNLSTNKGHS